MYRRHHTQELLETVTQMCNVATKDEQQLTPADTGVLGGLF
jgi:hypothetical protein